MTKWQPKEQAIDLENLTTYFPFVFGLALISSYYQVVFLILGKSYQSLFGGSTQRKMPSRIKESLLMDSFTG